MEDALAHAKREGNARFRAGEFAAATQHYGEAIDAARTLLAQLHCNRATAQLKLHALDAARRDAATAAELAPTWGKPHLRLAEIAAARRAYSEAVEALQVAQPLAQAADDRAVAKEVAARLLEYEAFLMCQQQDAATGGGSEDALRLMVGAIDRGARTFSSHDFSGRTAARVAPREDHPQELYERAKHLEDEEDVDAAMQLYERVSKMQVKPPDEWRWNRGIGNALAALGRYYDAGVYYGKNDALAVEYLTRGAHFGGAEAWNDLGVMIMHGTHGQKKNLALAKDYLRRAAELGDPFAMMNLGKLHSTIHDFATATRWAEAAVAHGTMEGMASAQLYRAAALQFSQLEPEMQQMLEASALYERCQGYVQLRLNHRPTPTIAELKAVKTRYCRRLLQAKKLMLHACESISEGELAKGVSLAAQAYKFDDAVLVFTPDEMALCGRALKTLGYDRLPMDPSLAQILQPSTHSLDPEEAMDFWYSIHEQFPDDFQITVRAAIAHSFLDGQDELNFEPSEAPKPRVTTGLKLFQRAMELLTANPSYNHRVVDPDELGFWFLSGVALWRASEPVAAKVMLEKFAEVGGLDGHRFGGEAHFILGLIELFPDGQYDTASAHENIPNAAEHLRLGVELQERLPAFLQPKNKSSNLLMLESTLRAAATSAGIAVNVPSAVSEDGALIYGTALRGGDLLEGPKRHAMLRSATSSLVTSWKQDRSHNLGGSIETQDQNADDETIDNSASRQFDGTNRELQKILVDEIVSGVEEQVYRGRVLECIVVAPLCRSQGVYQLIVEDSQREPIRVVLKTATKTHFAQLIPGQVVLINDPRLYRTEDQTVALMIREIKRDLQMVASHCICWNCSEVAPVDRSAGATFQSCSQCHRARYCSRECQKDDWKLFGHRNLCKSDALKDRV